MKKTILTVGLILLLMLALVACTAQPASPAEDPAVDPVAEEVIDETETADAAWTLTVNDVEIKAEDAALEMVTQTLQKQDKEGNLKDQECTGFALKSLLDYAEITDFATVTVTAADGYAYELTSDVALLPTTMIVLEQDGEAYELPRLAVEGEGSKAWVKDVASISAL